MHRIAYVGSLCVLCTLAVGALQPATATTTLSANDGDEQWSADDDRPWTDVGEDDRRRAASDDNDDDADVVVGTEMNCTRCAATYNDETKRMRLEAIKVQILSKLGMERPPNISQAQLASIPPLRHLMHRGLQDMPMADEPSQSRRDAAADAYDDDNDDYMLRPERIFSRSRTEVPEGFVRRVPDSIIFTFSPREMNMRASRAYLWFSLQPSRTLDAFIYVNVYIADKKHATRVRVLYRQKKVALSSGSSEWHSIEVRSLVAGWFRRIQQRHFELIVEAFDSSGRQLVIDSEPTSDDSVDTGDTMPLLEVRLQQQRHSRKKRMVGLDCDEFSHEERCCRYKLVVDFQEFGWDWILNPKRYDANYCSGECPFVFLQKYLHTHLVQQANPHGSAGPCCTPEKMSPLSMLYFDDSQNIMYGVLSGMIVDKCGCS